jgi:nicotinamidase-related amidase
MSVRGLDDGERAALVLNECQRGMVDPAVAGNGALAGEVARRGVVPRLAALAQACRAAGVLVVHSTIVPRADYVGTMRNCLLLASLVKKGSVVAGSPGAEIHPDLTPQDGDVVLERVHGLTPFHSTELEPILRSRGVQTVIVTGVSTNVGIPGACLEAVNRGFSVVVPEDCTAGAWPEAHEFQVTHTLPLLATVTSSAAVIDALAGRLPVS